MFCPQCSAENDSSKKYCRNCGFSLAAVHFVLEGHLHEAITGLGKSASAIRKGMKVLFTFISVAIFLAAFADPLEIIFAPFDFKISIHHWPTILVIGLVFGISAILIGYGRLRRVNRLLPSIDQSGRSTLGESNQPEGGWWWNPNEPGRGFFLEWQGGQLFMAGYMYDASGNPIWYLSTNTTPSSNLRSYSGTWWEYGNGQTLTGPYKPATRINDNVAPVTIQFSGPTTGLLTLPGGRTTAIERFRFADFGFKHTRGVNRFPRTSPTPNAEDVLLLLAEIFPDRIG